MKYIRTEDGIEKLDIDREYLTEYMNGKKADTIEELGDAYVIVPKDSKYKPYTVNTLSVFDDLEDVLRRNDIYLSIWVGALLKPAAKMNEKGELEMKFKEWLLANWDNLRKDTKHFSDDEHKVLDLENNSWWINYSHEKPLDSWDRLFALYLIDIHPECIDKTWDEVKDIEDIKDFDNGGYEGNKAYNNYEREQLSSEEAWREMTNVAKKGREAVLVDSYDEDGWFGAS